MRFRAVGDAPSQTILTTFFILFLGSLRAILFAVLCAFAATVHAAGMGVDDARHLLNRTGFGATPEQVAEFAKLSRNHAVTRLLQGAATDGLPLVAIPNELNEYLSPKETRTLRERDPKAFQQALRDQQNQLRAWWLQQMLTANTPEAQLRERMVLFWHNHFVSSIEKVHAPVLMLQQNQLYRQLALGRFSELLHAAAKEPAMVIYLDSASNRKGTPNENFAREVMELFTLGEGHYSEADVKEAARAFTGWSVDQDTGRFKWRPFAHDSGSKSILGQSGNFDGDDVLDILLDQPEAASFIVSKLWLEFVSPIPDAKEVERIARHWREAHYEIRVALSDLLDSHAFWAAKNRGTLIKSPVDLVVGTFRTFNVKEVDALPFVFTLRQLGQDLFAPPNVKGWPGGEAWINSNTLLLRKQFLDRLLRAESAGSANQATPSAMKKADLRDFAADRNMDKAATQMMMKSDDAMRLRMQRGLDNTRVDTNAWSMALSKAGVRGEAIALALPLSPLQSTQAQASSTSSSSNSTSNRTDALAPRPLIEQLRTQLLDVTYQLR